MSYTEDEQIEEQLYFLNIVATFERYERHSISANNRRRKDYLRLPPEDRELLESIGWKKKLDQVDAAIQANARFLRKVIMNPEIFEQNASQSGEEGKEEENEEEEEKGEGRFQAQPSHSFLEPHSHHSHASELNFSSHTHNHDNMYVRKSRFSNPGPNESDMDKLRSTLKQLVRDWAQEGKSERDACYLPMTEALLKYYSDVPESERRNYRVLVPGAGLARLALDVARLGFTCQGNEFSHHMLLASYFILNSSAMLRPITFPDVLPSNLPSGSDFSLVAGDFEEIYGAQENDSRGHDSQVGRWDAILTCFFIDTSRNIINYLRIIHRILTPGGVWINLGPLLWHFENNSSGDTSIEVDLEEVKSLADKIGFDIQQERVIETTYTSDQQSMLGYIYKAEFWVATKKKQSGAQAENPKLKKEE